ncbi:MAG TPA: hypothetical protein EYP98_04515, partial [Planctomycetes bacterium]|nr:hypothetical protein [Planctomycetota bacterium]
MSFSSRPLYPPASEQVAIEATVVDEALIREEMERLRIGLEEQVAARQTKVDAGLAALAARAQELREAIEAGDTWQGRWTADRATDKEARTRLEVEMRAAHTAREAQLRDEHAALEAELRQEAAA